MSRPGRQARRIAGYLRPYRGRMAAACALAVAESVLILVPIYVFKVVVDRLSGEKPTLGGVVVPILAAVGAAVAAATVSVASTYLVQSVGKSIVFDLREQLFTRLLGQSAGYYARTRGGDALSRILNDVGAIDAMLATGLLGAVRSGLAAGSTVAVMFVLDWRLAVLLLILAPAVLLPTRRAGRRIGRARGAVQEQLAAITVYLQETLGLSAMHLVRAFGRIAGERDRFAALNAELRRREVRAAMAARWFTAGIALLSSTGPAVIIVVGGYLVIHHLASLGTVLVFATLIAGRLGSSLQALATTATSLLGSVPVWERIFATLDERPDIVEQPGARRLPPSAIRGGVSFQDVEFAYAGQKTPAIRGVSFDIQPGQLLGVVGPSGAGKTTLGALIGRLMDPQAGVVRLDGHDVAGLTLETTRRAVGMVFQDTFLFHTTLVENLLYGCPDATTEKVEQALRAADLREVVDRLPNGLRTVVGERGHRLSGGEKQRVAIARAILKDPPILVLDEATSHLDGLAEQRVQRALQGLFAGRTAIVIAHRLSTIANADLILVLDGGAIVERGTHTELTAAGGLYARLQASQVVGVG